MINKSLQELYLYQNKNINYKIIDNKHDNKQIIQLRREKTKLKSFPALKSFFLPCGKVHNTQNTGTKHIET